MSNNDMQTCGLRDVIVATYRRLNRIHKTLTQVGKARSYESTRSDSYPGNRFFFFPSAGDSLARFFNLNVTPKHQLIGPEIIYISQTI